METEKGYVIKTPERALIVATVCSVKSDTIETYMDQFAIRQEWTEHEAEGFSCVEVEISTGSLTTQLSEAKEREQKLQSLLLQAYPLSNGILQFEIGEVLSTYNKEQA